jgi:hypothetical protein
MTTTQFKVRFYQDNEYEVIAITTSPSGIETETHRYKGSLSDCEAWIRLTQQGYMDE